MLILGIFPFTCAFFIKVRSAMVADRVAVSSGAQPFSPAELGDKTNRLRRQNLENFRWFSCTPPKSLQANADEAKQPVTFKRTGGVSVQILAVPARLLLFLFQCT